MSVKIVHLYPRELNLYGDSGNLICLVKRLNDRGIRTEIIDVGIGDRIPDFDIMLIGGGQDKEMNVISRDIRKKTDALSYYIENERTILAICGGYQLLGEYYKTSDTVIPMSGILPFYTASGDERMIGDTLFDTAFGTVVGFENHIGRTFLCDDLKPLGTVVVGFGNNGYDETEGMQYKNVFGTYAHGPVLPKNPRFADEIISRAVGDIMPLDDELEIMCHNALVKNIE